MAPLAAAPAVAQVSGHASASEASTLGEVVVTARKRDESIMATPVIMQALTSAEIQDRRITNTEQLSQVTPGLTILAVGGTAGANVNFRGLNNGYNIGLDTSLQLVLDGASTSASSLYTVGLMDVGQIEVLKGPQSLFYGKGASAGILSIRSADPTHSWEAKVTTSYEFNADEFITDAYVSGPITDDLGMRLAVNYDNMKGYFKNPNPNNPNHTVPDGDTIAGRLTLKYNPGGGPFQATLKYTQLHQSSDFGNLSAVGQIACTGSTPQIPSTFRDNCKLDNITMGVPNAPPFNPALRTNPFDVAGFQSGSGLALFGPGGDHSASDTSFLVGDMEYELRPGLTLSSVSSSTRFSTDARAAGFYGGIQNYRISGRVYEREYSQEFRITSDFKDSWINFMAGAYFNRMTFDSTAGFEIPQLPVAGVGTLGLFTENDTNFKDHTRAFFGQVLLTPIDHFELALGLRQTHARRFLTSLFARNNYPAFFNPGPAGEAVDLYPESARDYTETNTSPEATLTYRPTTDLTAFISYKRGYKGPAIRSPGGVTSYDPAFNGPGAVAPVKGEKVKGFEGGVKWLTLDRTLSVTASIYDYKYNDLQVTFIEPSGPSGALTGVLANGANARVRGVELGVDYMPPIVEGLTLSGFVNYNDSHFTQWDNAPCYVGQTAAQGCANGASQDLAGRQLENAPFWSGTLGADYKRSVGNGYRISMNANAKLSGAYMSYVSYNPNGHQSAYVTADLAAHFGPENERWDTALIMRNITDKHYLTNTVDFGTQTPGLVGDMVAYTNRGRQIAIQASLKY